MLTRKIRSIAPGLGLLVLTLNLAAQEAAAPAKPGVIELRQRANEAYASEDYDAYLEAVGALHLLRPFNDRYLYQLVLAHVLAGNTSEAYGAMLRMQQQGLTADFDLSQDTLPIRGTEAYAYINDLLKRAGEPQGAAELMFRLPAAFRLATSMAWDASRGAFLVGNARDGAVIAVSRDGEAREILRADADNGLWGVFGLLVDAPRNRLWVSSSADANFSGFDPVDNGRSALYEFKLDSLELVRKYPVPVDGKPHRLGGLVRTPGGDIIAVDTILPIVYRLPSGAEKLQPMVASADMVSMRGVALSDDGKRLYIADHELGVLVLDLEGRRAAKLGLPENFNAGGIEGLFFWDGHLVMIQNGIRPQRIMRLALSEDGMAATGVAPLAVAQPFFNYPNFGTLVGDELFFLTDSHWIRGDQALEPIGVGRTNVAQAPDLVPVDLEKFWEDYERSRPDG